MKNFANLSIFANPSTRPCAHAQGLEAFLAQTSSATAELSLSKQPQPCCIDVPMA